VERTPAWERFVYRVLSTDPKDDLDEALRWYEELARESFDPSVDLHLAILEGEAHRLDGVRRRTEEWERRPDPLPVFARLVGAAVLPPPWRGRIGVRVLIWGGALGAITLTVLYLASSLGPDRPYSRVLIGAATNLSFVPLVVLADRLLIRPAGLRLSESFGLVPTPDGTRRLVLVVLTLLALRSEERRVGKEGGLQ